MRSHELSGGAPPGNQGFDDTGDGIGGNYPDPGAAWDMSEFLDQRQEYIKDEINQGNFDGGAYADTIPDMGGMDVGVESGMGYDMNFYGGGMDDTMDGAVGYQITDNPATINPIQETPAYGNQAVEYPDPVTPAPEAPQTTPVDVPEQPNFNRVAEQEGSNEGGWYEDPDSHERFYVKFYRNPEQGRAEFIANAIYERLGIKSVRSEIVEIDGREGVASQEIPGNTPVDAAAQTESADVQMGFVADAYLANWDVIGLEYDNIVQATDGFYRVDNGGSLTFRAQGGTKDFSPDSIPELQSMLTTQISSGQVFSRIDKNQILTQAQNLVSSLTPEDITQIVDESGLDGELRTQILDGLLGRREYLANLLAMQPEVETPPSQTLGQAFDSIREKPLEQTGESILRPRAEISCDSSHIDGQKVVLINRADKGTVEVSFKLRDPSQLASSLATSTLNGTPLQRDKIVYDSPNSEETTTLCDANVFEVGDIKVYVADPTRVDGAPVSYHNSYGQVSHEIRAAEGLVKIEVPASLDANSIEASLDSILSNDFGIEGAFAPVEAEAEQEYMSARYKWQHKIEGNLTPEQIAEAKRLERREVSPGYSTYVEDGRYVEYLKKYGSDIRAIHSLNSTDIDSIQQVLSSGLLCSSARMEQGTPYKGASTMHDLAFGGGDNVFTRLISTNRMQQDGGAVIIFKPELLDRTDWYCYEEDSFGATDSETFAKRLSPEEILAKVSSEGSDFPENNEQMFRTGIGANYIEAIQVPNDFSRMRIIAQLKENGVTEFFGRPIEDVIVADYTPKPEFSLGLPPPPQRLTSIIDTENLDNVDGMPSFQSVSMVIDENYKPERFNLEPEERLKRKYSMLRGSSVYSSIDEIVEIAWCNGYEEAELATRLIDAAYEHADKDALRINLVDYLRREANSSRIDARTGMIDDALLGRATELLGISINEIFANAA